MDYNCRYDINGFTNDLGLNTEEVADLYAELIKEINSAIIEIKTLLDKKDYAKIQKVIHNIKGVSGNYRVTDVYANATKINDILKSNNYNYNSIELNLKNLYDICDNAVEEIQKYFNQRFILI